MRMRLSLAQSRRRGFNLIEASIVLGIVGLVIGGIWVAASGVYEGQRTQRMNEVIITSVNNLRSSLAGQTSLTAVTDARDILEAYWPTDLVQGTTPTPRHLWESGEVYAAIVAAGTSPCPTTTNGCLAITLAGVSRTACLDIIGKNSGSARDIGLVGVDASAGVVTAVDTVPSNAANLISTAASCTAAGNGNSVSLYFRVRI